MIVYPGAGHYPSKTCQESNLFCQVSLKLCAICFHYNAIAIALYVLLQTLCIHLLHSCLFLSGFRDFLSDLEWLWNQDVSRDLLLAVHPPNYIVLWNGDTGTKLWKKSYAENILSFSFDPFDPFNMACMYTIMSY